MEIDDQEDGATRRRSGRIRGRKPAEGDSPPSLVSGTGVLPVSPRGSRGRGRGRGRPAKTKNYQPEDDNSEGDGEGAGSDNENNMSSSQSDSDNSDSNPTNGFELSNNASMEVEDSADNYGYSAYTTADLTDTSAIDGQDYGIVNSEAEVGPEINFEGQKEFEAENSEPSNEVVYEQQDSEDRELIDQNQTSNSNATYGEEPSVSPEAVERDKDEEQLVGGSEEAEMENEADVEKEGDGGAKRKLDELENSTEASPEENSNSVSEGPTPAKKALLEINVRKLLPDLEKHWKPVEEDPNDFTAWTYLLQYVDQENELLAAREAYDGFLSRYPYCYGYWKKYADYEKRKGSAEDCEQVFRRGLKAISLSVDLWIHYLNYVKAAHENDQAYIRAQFDAAIDACGTEFRSDKLWDHYLQWEKEANNLKNVLSIYDQVIAMPTQSYQAHFQHMKDFIHLHPPADLLAEEEYLELKASIEPAAAAEEENTTEPDETTKIREKLIEKRTLVHKNTEAEITARWSFEEAIKRPYFHVKPLEKGQLKMWKEYLDFEIEKGIQKRIIVLFERCLIACALYEEYWIKYIKFLQTQKELDVEKLRSVFVRACTIHHQNKPWINMHWAAFEEGQGSYDKASEVLAKLYKMLPESIHVYYRHINLERRRGDFEKCGELFEKYISECKNKANAAHLTIKYARFVAKNVGDNDKAMKILQEAINLDESTRAKVVMALVNLAMEQRPVDTKLVLSTFEQVLKSEISNEQKITFAHRKVEFLEDYGDCLESVEKAQEELQSLAKLLRERKSSPDEGNKPPSSEDTKGSTSNGSTYNQYGQGQQQPPYGQQYNQYGQYSNWNYQQPSSYGYGNNQPGWSAYQGYYGGAEATTDA